MINIVLVTSSKIMQICTLEFEKTLVEIKKKQITMEHFGGDIRPAVGQNTLIKNNSKGKLLNGS